MQKQKKFGARILSMALTAAMVFTMLPTTVFAAEGDNTASDTSSVGTIKSFNKLEDRFTPSVGEGAPDYVYELSVALGTPYEDLQLPDELTAMVSRTVTAPAEDEPVVYSSKPSAPDEEVAGDTENMVSGNQPASPSDAEEEVKAEFNDDGILLASETADTETPATTVQQETISVTWNSSEEYNSDANGKFIYTAELPEGYILADGVNLPQIHVMVGIQANFTWNVYVAGKNITDGGYWKNSGKTLTAGGSPADYNAHWDADTDTLYLKDISTTAGSAGWPSAAIYIYESNSDDITGKRDVNIIIDGTNSVTNSGDFGLHIGRYGGLGTLNFSGTGSFTASSTFSSGYVPGATCFNGDGTYSFNVNTYANKDVGLQTGILQVNDTAKVHLRGSDYGIYVGEGLRVSDGAELTVKGSVAAFIANTAFNSLATFTPQYSTDDGVSWQNGIFEQQNNMTNYNGNTAFMVAKKSSGGDVANYVKISNINVTPGFLVTYDANGGTGTMTDSSNPYDPDATVTTMANSFTAPSGKTFGKWNTKADGTGTDYAAGTTFTIGANTTLYAQWEYSDDFTGFLVTYDANGGTGTMTDSSNPYDPDATVTTMANSFTAPSGKTFGKWNTKADGTGTDYAAGTTFTISANTTLYAQWETASSGGGSSSGGSSGSTTPTKDSLTNGKTNVSSTVDANGNANVTVTEQNVKDAIKAAQDAAKKEGLAGKLVSVEIAVTTDKAATQITATLPKTVQETLISNKVDSIKITSNTVSMSFSQTAIQQINTQAKADVTITATQASTDGLTGNAKTLVGSRPMFDFKATYGNGQTITNFGTDTVSIAIPYTLGQNETAGNVRAVYIDENGNATEITNSSYDSGKQAVIFTTNHFPKFAVGYKATSPVFTDIANHWAKTDIEFVASRGLMNGISDTIFSPNGSMTRGMFVTVLGRLAGVDANGYKTGKFTDVKTDAYYAPYVNWAAGKGIVKGTSDTTFAPDQVISRQEMAVIMSRYASALGYQVAETEQAVNFADNASIASWAAAAVKQMQMAGILNGRKNNTIDPTGTATRGEIAAMLHRFVELVVD